jgi:HPt (histidine-containing phosphotransfer) domain-containing protein
MENVISLNACLEMCDNDKEFMEEMIDLMRDDVKVCLNLLAKAFTDHDRTELRNVSHRIKGQAANMAAEELCEMAKKVEDAAKNGFCTKIEYLMLILSAKNFLRCTRYPN